jgi:hypothetical protein
MPKVSIRTAEQATALPLPAGFAGDGRASAYFAGERDPLHLHRIDLARGEHLRLEAAATDKLVYVRQGSVTVGKQKLTAGSSIIVEHGGHLDLVANENAALLAFGAAHPADYQLPGGHVHLLPAERAPRSDSLAGSPGLGGVMHADAGCATCHVWLHENRFPGGNATRQDAEAGIHSHSEDEIIFVLDGEVRLGARLYGPGTALAIAADTLYSFTAGPNGLHFANFRAAKPGDIRFANGRSISETGYWRERLPRPDYISPAN